MNIVLGLDERSRSKTPADTRERRANAALVIKLGGEVVAEAVLAILAGDVAEIAPRAPPW